MNPEVIEEKCTLSADGGASEETWDHVDHDAPLSAVLATTVYAPAEDPLANHPVDACPGKLSADGPSEPSKIFCVSSVHWEPPSVVDSTAYPAEPTPAPRKQQRVTQPSILEG